MELKKIIVGLVLCFFAVTVFAYTTSMSDVTNIVLGMLGLKGSITNAPFAGAVLTSPDGTNAAWISPPVTNNQGGVSFFGNFTGYFNSTNGNVVTNNQPVVNFGAETVSGLIATNEIVTGQATNSNLQAGGFTLTGFNSFTNLAGGVSATIGFTNIDHAGTPNLVAGNGSFLVSTDGPVWVRSNGVWYVH